MSSPVRTQRALCAVFALTTLGAVSGCARRAPSHTAVQARPGNESSAEALGATPGMSKDALKARQDAKFTRSQSEQELIASYDGEPALSVWTGKATYYANSLAGNRTASGERYDPARFTAAHRKLRFGSVVRVIRRDTGRYVYVTITDRGPFGSATRIIDLSRVAAERLGMIRAGVVDVRLELVLGGQ